MQKRVLGIIGHPVGHSLSPLMHNAAADILGLPFVYVAFDVKPADFRKAMASLRVLGVAGVNITVPHKEAAARCVDELSEDARLMGAVNTISNRGGRLYGDNTDGHGFLRSLSAAGFNPRDKKVAIIGAGGSARAIGVSLLTKKAREVVVINRTASRGRALARHLSSIGRASFIASGATETLEAVKGSDLVVQTTSAGMGDGAIPLEGVAFRRGQLVYDIIYSPSETGFLKAARSMGAKTANGLGMLVYQGSESFRIWTGKRFPEKAVFGRLKRFLAGGK